MKRRATILEHKRSPELAAVRKQLKRGKEHAHLYSDGSIRIGFPIDVSNALHPCADIDERRAHRRKAPADPMGNEGAKARAAEIVEAAGIKPHKIEFRSERFLGCRARKAILFMVDPVAQCRQWLKDHVHEFVVDGVVQCTDLVECLYYEHDDEFDMVKVDLDELFEIAADIADAYEDSVAEAMEEV